MATCNKQLVEYLKSLGKMLVYDGRLMKTEKPPPRYYVKTTEPGPNSFLTYMNEIYDFAELFFESIRTKWEYNVVCHKCHLRFSGAFPYERLYFHSMNVHKELWLTSPVFKRFRKAYADCEHYVQTTFQNLKPTSREIFLFYEEQDMAVDDYVMSLHIHVLTTLWQGKSYYFDNTGTKWYYKYIAPDGVATLRNADERFWGYMKYLTMIGEFVYSALPNIHVNAIAGRRCVAGNCNMIFSRGPRLLQRAIQHLAAFHPPYAGFPSTYLQVVIFCSCTTNCRTNRCPCYMNQFYCQPQCHPNDLTHCQNMAVGHSHFDYTDHQGLQNQARPDPPVVDIHGGNNDDGAAAGAVGGGESDSESSDNSCYYLGDDWPNWGDSSSSDHDIEVQLAPNPQLDPMPENWPQPEHTHDET
jgi:hypothetical protein